MQPDCLINISGGIDSVYSALKCLESGGRPILHHCVLKSRTSRWSYEKKAVMHALAYFRRNNLNDFVYIESGFDYGTVGHLVYDVEIIGFLTGVVLRNPKYSNVNKVIVSVNKDDPSGRDINAARRVTSNGLADLMVGRSLEFLYPYISMTKADIIKDMPKELISGLWWCRTPKNGNRCNKCRACRESNQFV